VLLGDRQRGVYLLLADHGGVMSDHGGVMFGDNYFLGPVQVVEV